MIRSTLALEWQGIPRPGPGVQHYGDMSAIQELRTSKLQLGTMPQDSTGRTAIPTKATPQNHHLDLEAQPTHLHTASTFPAKSTSVPDIDNSTKRRSRRTATAESYRPQRWGQKWQPGQEPGIPAAALRGPKTECDITVVDFSQDDIHIRHLDNDSLKSSLEIPREDWVVCRWINVNGISGDVIQLLASYKNFHRLAIEDMLNNHNRTKADWYADHTYSM